MQKLVACLTNEQIEVAKLRASGVRNALTIRGKAKAVEYTAKGFELEKISGQYYAVTWEQSKAIYEYLTAHGKAVKVVRVEEKYSDNNGPYEVIIVEDENGVQWGVGNCYDTKVCFRYMSENELLGYANK